MRTDFALQSASASARRSRSARRAAASAWDRSGSVERSLVPPFGDHVHRDAEHGGERQSGEQPVPDRARGRHRARISCCDRNPVTDWRVKSMSFGRRESPNSRGVSQPRCAHTDGPLFAFRLQHEAWQTADESPRRGESESRCRRWEPGDARAGGGARAHPRDSCSALMVGAPRWRERYFSTGSHRERNGWRKESEERCSRAASRRLPSTCRCTARARGGSRSSRYAIRCSSSERGGSRSPRCGYRWTT